MIYRNLVNSKEIGPACSSDLFQTNGEKRGGR